MAEKLTNQQVRHVAMLARLKLDDNQLHQMAEQLSSILGYVEKIGELELDDVEPMAHPTGMSNKLRADEPATPPGADAMLASAPESDPPFFKVPKALGGRGSG